MKRTVLVVGLLLIVLANFIMVYYAPYGMSREGFQMNGYGEDNMNSNTGMNRMNNSSRNTTEGFQMNSYGEGNMGNSITNNVSNANEGFTSFLSAGGAKDGYHPMGQFDGVKLSTGNSVSEWRYTAPNEPLTGAEFVPSDDDLFMFKNNQCKPECCGASFSCGGGCVCTTPQQRQYIAGRGGNRTEPEDGL